MGLDPKKKKIIPKWFWRTADMRDFPKRSLQAPISYIIDFYHLSWLHTCLPSSCSRKVTRQEWNTIYVPMFTAANLPFRRHFGRRSTQCWKFLLQAFISGIHKDQHCHQKWNNPNRTRLVIDRNSCVKGKKRIATRIQWCSGFMIWAYQLAQQHSDRQFGQALY